MATFPALVYLLCLATSITCLVLLVRGYRRNRVKLLFWSALCFVGLAFNNFFLFLDAIVFPDISFMLVRNLSTLLALVVLLYGFIWEAD